MSETTPSSDRQKMTSKLMRGSIWIAIGSLIAAALVCVVWVLIGDQDGIIGRAFLTILLLAAFAGIAIVESNLAERRPDWLALTSMISWIVVLLVGAVKIWLPQTEWYGGWGITRFMQLLLVVAILQLALLHVRLYSRASRRYVTTFTRVVTMVTFALLAILVALLVFFLTFPDQFDYDDLYWRIVIALTILVAVGTTLIPLLNALFAPRAPRAPRPAPLASAPQGVASQPAAAWPTYADGRTPLPVMPDGSPDWNAYYTGYPSYAAPAPAPAQSFPVLDAPAGAAPASVPQTPPMPPSPAGGAPTAPAHPGGVPAAPAHPGGAPTAPAHPGGIPAAPARPTEHPAQPTPAADQPAPPAPSAPPVPPVPPAPHGSFPPPPPAGPAADPDAAQ